MGSRFALLILVFVCTAGAHAGETDDTAEPHRRIVFDLKVPMGKEAPSLAADGHLVAIGSGTMVYVVDVRTGKTVAAREAMPGATLYDVHVLDYRDGRIYACARNWSGPKPPEAEDGWVLVAGGRRVTNIDVVTFRLDGTDPEHFLRLPASAKIADRLLGTSLVYADQKMLSVLSLAGGEQFSLAIGGEPVARPVVTGDEVFGLCEGSAYAYRRGDREVRIIPFPGTPLASIPLDEFRGNARKTAGLIVAGCDHRVVACDLDGNLRWRLPGGARVSTGSGGEICAISSTAYWEGSGAVSRLAPEDGKPLWRGWIPHGVGHGTGRDVDCAPILAGRLIAVGDMVSVLDARTGELLINLPWGRRLEGFRRLFHLADVFVRMELVGDILVIGFENWVCGIDLTPTAEVPSEYWATDPANPVREIKEFEARPAKPPEPPEESEPPRTEVPPGVSVSVMVSRRDPRWEKQKWRRERVEALAAIGRNMEDVPELAAEVLPFLKDLLADTEPPRGMFPVGPSGKRPGVHSHNKVLLAAFHWLDVPLIVDAMREFLEDKRNHDYDAPDMVELLAFHPDTERALPILREIAADPKAYIVGMREAAARHLRVLEAQGAPSSEDLRLLYSGDHDAAVAAFAKRLREADAAGRKKLLKLLSMAPDAVIIALAKEFEKLPEGEQAAGSKLVEEAKARLGAIAGFDDRD